MGNKMTIMRQLKDQILATKAGIAIDPTTIIHLVNTFCEFKDLNLSPAQRKLVRKNIADLFKLIKGHVESIQKKFPGTLSDNIFYREILRGLKDLKDLYDFFGRMPSLEVEEKTIKPLFKNTSQITSFPKVQYPIHPPEKTTDAVDILVAINQICRFVSIKVRVF